MAPLKLEFACMKDFGRITNNIKTMREHRQQVKVMAASDAIDMYIAGCPEHVRELLVQMRVAIREAAPGAEEVISYAMPAYKLNGMLVYFAAFKNHIGFYPTSSATSAFKDELAAYRSGKGSTSFRWINLCRWNWWPGS